MQPRMGIRRFLPSQIPPLEVLVEFSFLSLEHGQLAEGHERHCAFLEHSAVTDELLAEFVELPDCAQPPLSGNQVPELVLLPQNYRVHQPAILDRGFQLLQRLWIEVSALPVRRDVDLRYVNGMHSRGSKVKRPDYRAGGAARAPERIEDGPCRGGMGPPRRFHRRVYRYPSPPKSRLWIDDLG